MKCQSRHIRGIWSSYSGFGMKRDGITHHYRESGCCTAPKCSILQRQVPRHLLDKPISRVFKQERNFVQALILESGRGRGERARANDLLEHPSRLLGSTEQRLVHIFQEGNMSQPPAHAQYQSHSLEVLFSHPSLFKLGCTFNIFFRSCDFFLGAAAFSKSDRQTGKLKSSYI